MDDTGLRVLIVDDEASLRVPLQSELKRQGYRVDVAADGEEALQLLAAADGQYDVVVLDKNLIPDPDGITVMKEMRRRWPSIEYLIMTGWDDLRDTALAAGAFAYLQKPFDLRELVLWLRSAGQAVRSRQIQDAILRREHADEVLRLVAQNARALLQADETAIVLAEIGSCRLRVHDLPAFERWTRHFKERLLSREIMDLREPVFIPDLNKVEGLDERFAASGYRSLIGEPIVLGDRSEGVLYAYSRKPGHFDDWARSALHVFARFAALAVGNLDMTRHADAYAAYSEPLLALSRALVRAKDEQELLELAWAFVRDTLRVDTFFVAFYDQATDTLWFPAAYDMGRTVPVTPRKLAGAEQGWGIAGYAVKRNSEITWHSEADMQKRMQSAGFAPVVIGDNCLSVFCIPIQLDGEPVGSLSIQSHAEFAFTPAQMEACRGLGRLLAPAIDNVRKAAQQRKSERQHVALNDLTLRIAAEDDQEALLNLVIEAALPLLDAEGGAIYLLEPTEDRFRLAAARPHRFGVEFTGRDEGIKGLVLRTRKAQAIPKYHEWDQRVKELDSYRLTAVAAAPIRLGDWILGTLNVHRTTENEPFTGDDLLILEQIASHAGLALQKAKLAQQSQQLQQLSATIAQWSDYEQVLTEVCKAGVSLFSADHSGLLLFDDDLRAGSVAAEWPSSVGARGLRIPLADVPAEERLVHDNEEIIISDLDDAREGLGPVYDILRGLGIRSLAIVPITYQGQKLGSLSLDAMRQPRQFVPEEVEFMKAFAAQAAIAITNARLYAQSKQRGDLLAALDRAAVNVLNHSDDPDILIHVARSAAEMLRCRTGCLFAYHRYTEQLEVVGVYGLPDHLTGVRLPVSQAGFAGQVARATRDQHLAQPLSTDTEQTVAGITFSVCAGVPLNPGTAADYVLLLGECAHGACLSENEVEVLGRFASQSALLLRTASILAPDRRAFAQLSLLHRISEYIQEATKLETITSVALTGATAGYGLGFNRAALFLLDAERGCLVGHTGIGNLTEKATYEAWTRDHQWRRYTLDDFISLWEAGKIEPTEAHRRVSGLAIPLEASGIFGRVLESRRHERFDAGQRPDLPAELVAALAPDGPMVIAPLGAGDKAVGVLLVDNKFTRVPVNDQSLEALLTLINEMAIVIRNHQLHERTRKDKERLQLFLETGAALVAGESPADQVSKNLNAALAASEAQGASVILLDRRGHMEKVYSAGIDKKEEVRDLVRPNGLSMRVLLGLAPYEKIEDADKERAAQRDINSSAPWGRIKAALCLPVTVEGDRRGVMWFHYESPRVFKAHEIAYFQIFVNQAALAYDASRRVEVLERMREAAQRLAANGGDPATLQAIVEEARKVLGAQAAWLWRYDSSTEHLDPQSCVSAGLDDSEAAAILRTPPRRGFTSTEILKQGSIEVEDTQDPEKRGPLDAERSAALAANSLYSLRGERLAVGEKTHGVLYVGYGAPRTFTEWERQMARNFSYHAALAIDNFELVTAVRVANKTAAAVAEMSTLGRLSDVMESVATEFARALHCDTVTIYSYDAERKQFDFPPATYGLREPEQVLALRHVEMKSSVGRVMELSDARFSTDARNDSIFNQGKFLSREGVFSSVGIPLKERDEKVGAVFLGYRAPHQFTQDEKESVRLLANTAAIKVGNAQLYQRTQDDARMRSAIVEAGRRISEARSLEKMLAEIARQAVALSRAERDDADGVFAHVALKFGSWLRFMVASDPARVFEWRRRFGDIDLKSENVGITGAVALTRYTRNIPDIQEYKRQGGPYLPLDEGTQSELCVPMVRGGRVLGIINLEHPKRYAFADNLQRYLEILADQAAIAVENALLLERLQMVSEISRDTAQPLELQPFLERLFGRLAKVFRLRRTPVFPSLATFDAKTGRVDTHLTRFYTKAPRIESRDVSSPGIIPHVIRSREPYYAPDVSQQGSKYYPYRRGTRSELAVPIFFGDTLLGALDIESSVLDPFEPGDVDFMKQLANHVATHLNAIQQFQLLAEQRQQLVAQAAVNWIGMVGSVFRHSVDRNAATIRDDVVLVRRAFDRGDRSDADHWLEVISQLANAILDKPLSTPLSSEQGAEEIALNNWLEGRIGRMWTTEPYRRVPQTLDLALMADDCVRASSEWLRLALEIVLQNAARAALSSAKPRIEITTRRNEEYAEMLITDTGPGIPEAVQRLLFREPIPKAAGESGMGLGLLLASMIFEVYKGKIEVATTGPAGTTIRISLPLVADGPKQETTSD